MLFRSMFACKKPQSIPFHQKCSGYSSPWYIILWESLCLSCVCVRMCLCAVSGVGVGRDSWCAGASGLTGAPGPAPRAPPPLDWPTCWLVAAWSGGGWHFPSAVCWFASLPLSSASGVPVWTSLRATGIILAAGCLFPGAPCSLQVVSD